MGKKKNNPLPRLPQTPRPSNINPRQPPSHPITPVVDGADTIGLLIRTRAIAIASISAAPDGAVPIDLDGILPARAVHGQAIGGAGLAAHVRWCDARVMVGSDPRPVDWVRVGWRGRSGFLGWEFGVVGVGGRGIVCGFARWRRGHGEG